MKLWLKQGRGKVLLYQRQVVQLLFLKSGNQFYFLYLFIWVLTSFSTHCIGHIMPVVLRAEETSTYSWTRFCTVNYQQTASNDQLSHLGQAGIQTPISEVGGKSVTTLPARPHLITVNKLITIICE